MNDDIIQTERLHLRKPRASDLDAYTRYCSSARSVFVGGPFDAFKAFDKLAAMIGHWDLRGFGRYIFCRRKSGEPLGHVGALQLDLSRPPEMTWTIWDGKDEGHGYALEACRAYCGHVASQPVFSSMIARIMPDNIASRRIAEKLGGTLNPEIPAPDWYPGSIAYEFNRQDPH